MGEVPQQIGFKPRVRVAVDAPEGSAQVMAGERGGENAVAKAWSYHYLHTQPLSQIEVDVPSTALSLALRKRQTSHGGKGRIMALYEDTTYTVGVANPQEIREKDVIQWEGPADDRYAVMARVTTSSDSTSATLIEFSDATVFLRPDATFRDRRTGWTWYGQDAAPKIEAQGKK